MLYFFNPVQLGYSKIKRLSVKIMYVKHGERGINDVSGGVKARVTHLERSLWELRIICNS